MRKINQKFGVHSFTYLIPINNFVQTLSITNRPSQTTLTIFNVGVIISNNMSTPFKKKSNNMSTFTVKS